MANGSDFNVFDIFSGSPATPPPFNFGLPAPPQAPAGTPGPLPQGGPSTFSTGDPLERFSQAISDPVARQVLRDQLAAATVLPEEFDDKAALEKLLKGLFAKAELPPDRRQAASTGAGPQGIGQTARGENFQLPLFQQFAQPQQFNVQSLGQLIRGR